ncbi:MAG: hypothetical protein ABL308_12920 [Oceanicaulis sp.]
MVRTFFISALCAAALTAGASAAPAGPAQDDGPTEVYNALEEAALAAQTVFGPDETCPQALDAPVVVVPVVRGEAERLAGYAFLTPRVCLRRGNRFDYIAKVHILNDRFVRAGHRAPLRLSDDESLDKSITHAAFLEAAGEIIEADRIDRLDLLGEDVRYIR